MDDYSLREECIGKTICNIRNGYSLFDKIKILNETKEELKSNSFPLNTIQNLFRLYFPEIYFTVRNNKSLMKIIETNKGNYKDIMKESIYGSKLGLDIDENYELIIQILLNSKDLSFKKKTDFLNKIEHQLSKLLEIYTPNLIKFIPKEIVLKLLIHTTGLKKLSKLTGGKIQILGAEKAISAHKINNKPTPKYGYLFFHPAIQKSLSGKDARWLANKCAIAVKIDYFDKKPNKDFYNQVLSHPMMRYSTSPEGLLK